MAGRKGCVLSELKINRLTPSTFDGSSSPQGTALGCWAARGLRGPKLQPRACLCGGTCGPCCGPCRGLWAPGAPGGGPRLASALPASVPGLWVGEDPRKSLGVPVLKGPLPHLPVFLEVTPLPGPQQGYNQELEASRQTLGSFLFGSKAELRPCPSFPTAEWEQQGGFGSLQAHGV